MASAQLCFGAALVLSKVEKVTHILGNGTTNFLEELR